MLLNVSYKRPTFSEHGLKSHYIFIVIFLFTSCSIDNSLPVEKERQAAQYNMQLGLAYLSRGDMVLAKKKLVRSLEQNPNSSSANSAMAYFMEKVGDYKYAEIYYKKSLLLAPGMGQELNNYAAFLCRMGQYQKAERYFMLAANDVKYANVAAVYENAGVCNMLGGNYKKAVLYFTKTLKYDPSRRDKLCELMYKNNKQLQIDCKSGIIKIRDLR